MDRNIKKTDQSDEIPVALLAEGVDRNNGTTVNIKGSTVVALLAEGVDRNVSEVFRLFPVVGSPSSRRAWIEIFCVACDKVYSNVALLAEGVDRNFMDF